MPIRSRDPLLDRVLCQSKGDDLIDTRGEIRPSIEPVACNSTAWKRSLQWVKSHTPISPSPLDFPLRFLDVVLPYALI